MYPSVEHEVARRRRLSAGLLAVAVALVVIAAIRQPSLVPFLLANFGLGLLFGLFSARNPEPIANSLRSVAGSVGFFLAWDGVRRILLEPAPGDAVAGLWQGLAAVGTGIAIAGLFAARSSVERRQRWWAEHGLTLGLPQRPETFKERWDWELQLRARVLTPSALRAYFAIACVMTATGVLGVVTGMWIAGVLVVLGVWAVWYFAHLLRLNQRSDRRP